MAFDYITYITVRSGMVYNYSWEIGKSGPKTPGAARLNSKGQHSFFSDYPFDHRLSCQPPFKCSCDCTLVLHKQLNKNDKLLF